MTVQELIKELSVFDSNTQVFIKDGYHFMREHPIHRVEGEYAMGYNTDGGVILVGAEDSGRD